MSAAPFPALLAGERITQDEFALYLKRVAAKLYHDQTQRIGQAYFNALHDSHPAIADDFRGGDLDPFYRDGMVPQFLAFLAQEYVR